MAGEVGKVDLEPEKSALAERPRLIKREQTAANIRAEMVQVRRNRVRAPAEIDRVRKVNRLRFKLRIMGVRKTF